MSLDVAHASIRDVETAVREHLEREERSLTEREMREAIAPDDRSHECVEMFESALRGLHAAGAITVTYGGESPLFSLTAPRALSREPHAHAA